MGAPHGKAKLKIFCGALGGRFIFFQEGQDLRPTLARVREAVMSMARPYLASHGFIDCCAGSGAIGFEAYSCGFRPVVWTDIQPGAVRDLRENARELGAESAIYQSSALALDRLDLPARPWMVYADPPFREDGFHQSLLDRLSRWDFIAPGSIYIAESERAPVAAAGAFVALKQRRYGRTHIAFLEKAGSNGAPSLSG